MPRDRSRAPQGRSKEVWAKRAKNALALLAIGDGVMQIVAPQEHIGWLSEHPRYTRLLGAAQVGGAVWFALRQYRST